MRPTAGVSYCGSALRCPVCYQAFYVEVPEEVALLRFETDFRPVYEGPDPLATDIHACPNCCYAGFAPAFGAEAREVAERTGLPPPYDWGRPPEGGDLQDLRRWIASGELYEEVGLEPGAEPHPALRYLLAASCREFLEKQPALSIFDLLLRGAWCARSTGATKLEGDLLVEAEGLLHTAIEGGEIPQQEKARFLYWAGELARRTGAFGRALSLFGQVEELLDKEEEEDEHLLFLVQRQQTLASAQSAVPADLPLELTEAFGFDGALFVEPKEARRKDRR